MKFISLHGCVYPEFFYICKMNDYVSIINFIYYNLYGYIMLGKYYSNITLHLLYFHLTIICLQVLCTNIIINNCMHYESLIIYFVVVILNVIQTNEYACVLVDFN